MDLLSRMASFVRVVEAGSLSAAARQLHVSVAAVSRHISELEASVKISLVARTTRRMTVTLAGQRYYERCLRVLREVDTAQAIAGELDDRPIMLSVPVSFGVEAATGLLGPLLAEQPNLRIDLRLDDRVVDLALDDVDVAVRVTARPPVSDQIIAQPLTSWPRVLVAAPSYLQRRGAPSEPDAVAGHATLCSIRDTRWTLTDGARSVEVRPAPRVTSNAGHTLRDLAIAGHGIALLPVWFVARDVARRRLRRVLPAWQTPPATIYVLYRAELRRQRRVKQVVEHLRRAYPATVT